MQRGSSVILHGVFVCGAALSVLMQKYIDTCFKLKEKRSHAARGVFSKKYIYY